MRNNGQGNGWMDDGRAALHRRSIEGKQAYMHAVLSRASAAALSL